MNTSLKLGTRRSLLAWSQSSWVARELERLNPGVKVELVGIDTRGDKIQDVPLQSVQGKEFFVAEIDEALRACAVDLTVHSMKDLSLDRPAEFICGAIPRRENPRDVILFGPGVMEKLRSGKKLLIGTSSPRRMKNIPPFLGRALPGGRADTELGEIRGNVNTRLSRVREEAGSARHLDAVVLAFAGLIRLWADEKGRMELRTLLEGVRWMILPLRECPAAPAQGALAVECRKDDERVRRILAPFHDAETESHVRLERQLLSDWGGGCHQKFGATAISTDRLEKLLFIRGEKPDGEFVEELRWASPRMISDVESKCVPADAWDGSRWRTEHSKDPEPAASPESPAVFVAHARAFRPGPTASRIRTSGVPSWFKLAEAGCWVEGCAEGLGFEFLRPCLREGVLQLPAEKLWSVVTHDQALDGWVDFPGKVTATYKVPREYPPAARQALEAARYIFWSSGSQYDELKGSIRIDAIQACGPGKTVAHLERAGVRALVFPSAEEWRKWLKIKPES